ncbi:1-deoxy-D-xylulose-5-phosphate reductoisomerase [Treponema primitia]|uniref:1-deoxy-D-xylulose-5-phosphate reductoisomerase n=1 Tax=Treponema primitia TaxID=88058 RepID=UPI00025558CD|nr:1-deoxy-D-xylulose-5-phosphate reductoisomerase [Treponema primitia]
MKKRVAILGVTGSIGRSTLEVIRAEKDSFEPILFSSHTSIDELLTVGKEFPDAVLVLSGQNQGIEHGLKYGLQDLLKAIQDSGADIVVNGITGAAGLVPSLVSLEAGADLALANKETIVMAAPLVFDAAAKGGGKIIPIDSEHSAIFNLINAHGIDRVEEILLTASGGPFRKYTAEALMTIRPEEALVHPTWAMGPKITVDSATLANKGLEVIEAAGLFHIPVDKIRVVVHPQSIIHSMIRLTDGAVYAQLSKPDIRLPIHEALNFPECVPCAFGRLGFDALTLEFEKPDNKKFPMLPLAYEAVRSGGITPTVYNAANEVAVAAFLAKGATFLDIPRIVENVLTMAWPCPHLDLPSILEADAKARQSAQTFIAEKCACAGNFVASGAS